MTLKIRTWGNSEKRFGIACFVSAKPADPEGDGDAFEAFDNLEEARAWMERAYKAGRFRHFTVWDGISGSWEQLEYFPDE
jgi:hypothetical protein